MSDSTKLINFEKYCPICEFWDRTGVDKPCDTCLSIPAREGTEKPEKFKSKTSDDIYPGYFKKINKIKDYLYEIWYDETDRVYAENYLESGKDISCGLCSSVRNGNWYGRNYDWTYDETAEFVVHLQPLSNIRFASIGLAGGISKLTGAFVDSKEKNDIYKLIPFMIQDGINEHGLVANMNVVPLDKGENVSYPTVSRHTSVSGLMLVRYILDKFESAVEAVYYIKQFVSVYFPKKLHDAGYELHYMVADKENTYLLEFINGETVITDISSKPFMTNFYLSDVKFNDDGSVYSPIDFRRDPIEENNITPYGSGLERYNYILKNYDDCDSREGMRKLMTDLSYTRIYTDEVDYKYWFTEFVGFGLTVRDIPAFYEPVIEEAKEYYVNRSRNDGGKTWQTVHSSVYSIEDKVLYLVTQEDGHEYTFKLKVVNN